jgi:VWFA-related protein
MRRSSSYLLAIAFVALLAVSVTVPFDNAAAQSDAQNKPPAPQPAHTFKSQTELVLVPVVVHGHDETHVPGLTKNDFIVQENRVDQKITVFEEVRTSGAPVHRVATPGVFTNAVARTAAGAGPSETPTSRLNIIVLDTINTPFLDQGRARQDLIKFLAKSVERGELTSLLTIDRGGVHVVHDFTTDSAVLIAALQRVKGKTDAMSGENVEAMNNGADLDSSVAREAADIQDFLEAQAARIAQGFSIQYTLDGFQTIARAFGGIPGRKALIWVTGGFPFTVTQVGEPPYARGYEDDMNRAFQLLNDANISVYPVDARGLVVAMPDISRPTRFNPRNPAGPMTSALAANSARLDTMRAFAAETGGRAFINTNDLEGSFRKAADDSASYYLLGYYRDTSNSKPGWRKLKVKVARDGVHLRARAGYFVNASEKERDKETDQKEDKTDFRLAISSPMDFTGVVFAVRFKDPVAAGANRQVNYDLVIDRDALAVDDGDNNHLRFEVLAMPRNSVGENVAARSETVDAHLTAANYAEIRRSGLGYHGGFQVPPGQYMVRFVVKDHLSGRIGTVSAPLKVD